MKSPYLSTKAAIIIILVLAASAVLFFRGGVAKRQVNVTPNAIAQVSELTFDWGEVSLTGGDVYKSFNIINLGTEPLFLSNVATSCMCTTAQLIIGGKASPLFGMHSKSDYSLEVPPGETAELKVVFDPAFHGPSGLGPITRQVTLSTNALESPILTFELAATVSQRTAAQALATQVIPDEGFELDILWGDTGRKLVSSGAIDMNKYRQIYKDEALLSYLESPKNEGILINKDNAYFWVNTFWALGLAQKSDVLDKGVMGTQHKESLGNFASIGGWTLGVKDALSLYSSSNIIPLTQEQQDLVGKISAAIYRPCCGNPTSFPDCNHGMAILGLLELMASQGANGSQMYKASLAFNSYWFPTTYTDLAYYFQTKENLAWDDVDPKRALASEFSSAQGYAQIKKQIGSVPGTLNEGASCGA